MIMNSLNGLVSYVWRIEIKQKAESNNNVQRPAKIFPNYVCCGRKVG